MNTLESRQRMDEATGGRPALLKDDSKHNRWVNTRALELAGITGQSPDPRAGKSCAMKRARPPAFWSSPVA